MLRSVCLCVFLLLLVGGCAKQILPERSPHDATMFGPARMRIHPIFTQVKDWTGDGKPDGIEALIEFQDRFDDPTKASGNAIFELFDYRPYNSDPRGDRVINPWTGSLVTVDEQRARWNRTLSTYSFRLPFQNVSPSRNYVLALAFDRSAGEGDGAARFFDRIVIEASQRKEPTGGAAADDAASPATRPVAPEPVPTLLARVRAELPADFPPGRPIRVSRAPGRLDVMGGIADYTGSLVCEATLDRAAAVALTERDDRELQVFSFNLFDEHQPFTFRMPLDALARASVDDLRREFAEPGRKWAGYLAGCLFVLHEAGLVDLRDPAQKGLNLALLSTVPLGAGVSSSAAIEVATMMNLVEHFGILREETSHASTAAAESPSLASSRSSRTPSLDPLRLAALCQSVENRIVGAPCGIMDQVTSCVGEAGALLRMVCQPHELLPSVSLPPGVRVIGINSNVRHSVGGGMYGRTRCAAFMAHRIILDHMRAMGERAGRTLTRDPMNGYLANLDPDDYKNLFRPHLPEQMRGDGFLKTHGGTVDAVTSVEADVNYHVRSAADHHVLEARRVRRFVDELELATRERAENPTRRSPALDRAGHLMYASHLSYTNDALLGADECDLLVKLVRDREHAGLYGAKITGGGSGGTVAVLCDASDAADSAIREIMDAYAKQTGKTPEAFTGTSPGAWHVGTCILTNRNSGASYFT